LFWNKVCGNPSLACFSQEKFEHCENKAMPYEKVDQTFYTLEGNKKRVGKIPTLNFFKSVAEGNTLIVNCQLSTVN